MSKVDSFETSLLELIFLNTAITGIGNAGGLLPSSVAGSFYIALFTSDPGETGSVAGEATYTGYARKVVARGAAEWSVVSGVASNDNAIAFAACTGGTNNVTHFGIMKAGTRDIADMIYSGALGAARAISDGYTPEFAAGVLTVTEG